jgi:hypothetical protein
MLQPSGRKLIILSIHKYDQGMIALMSSYSFAFSNLSSSIMSEIMSRVSSAIVLNPSER